ncbi:MAG: hypothetical protein HYS18_13175 [Burkholderiales bacterium]|nr:hypothetical protein [Burkholderiales bacterium]
MGRLYFVAVVLMPLLVACAVNGVASGERSPNQKTSIISAAADVISMAIWTVPQGGFTSGQPIQIQVSPIPQTIIEQASLRAISGDKNLVITSPSEIALSRLQPPQVPAPQKESATHPPALGVTTIRSFEVLPQKPGSYTVQIIFEHLGKIQTREIELKVN